MVSILGGKWTTYRAMAQEAVDAVGALPDARARGIPAPGPSRTRAMRLLGADRAGIVVNQKYERIPVTLRESYGLDKDVARHLSMNYGTRALQVAELARAEPALAARLAPGFPVLAAEVAFAADQEYAVTAVDVLARRTRLAFLSADAARAATPAVVALLARAHGWAPARARQEAARAEAFLKTMEAPAPARAPAPAGEWGAAAAAPAAGKA